MSVAEVTIHQVASVTEQESGKASGEGTKWRTYVFKNEEGEELLKVAAFHTDTESALESTMLPFYPL